MRMQTFFLSMLLAITGLGPVDVFAQQADEDLRGAFLTTRPKAEKRNTSTPVTRPSRRRPKTKTSGSDTAGPKTSSTNDPSASTGPTAKRAMPRMGLGLTLFMRDSNGLAVRTDPAREFRKGDRVRVLLETNADGYLYIFNTTNDGPPVMIYPQPELDEAGNFITAHVPFEIPASTAAEERLRWFRFDENAGAEKLYFVFTREPLAGAPIEDDLISFCRANEGKCPWNPSSELWSEIQKELTEPVKSVKAVGYGKSQTSGEREAVARGIGLNRDDPEPTLIMLTASTNKNMLVATLNLVHKAIGPAEAEDETTGW